MDALKMSTGLLMHVRANPLLGTSRLLRSLSLAQHWVASGGHATFVTGRVPGLLVRKMAICGCKARYLSTPDSKASFAKRLCELAEIDCCQTLVVDDSSPELIQNVVSQMGSGQQLVVLGKSSHAKVNFCSADEPAYALIRRNLELSPPFVRSGKSSGSKAIRCLLDLQRLDWSQLSELIDYLASRFSGTSLAFDVVSPFSAQAADTLVDGNSKLRDSVVWHRNPDRVFHSLAHFQMAVMTDVANFFEVAYCQLPGLLVNHRCGDSASSELTDAPWRISQDRSAWQQRICDWIAEMARRPALRRKHASQMRRLVDNQGAQRLCRAIRRGRHDLLKTRSA